MGRRAKKAPVVTKKRPTLSKRFKCPFCANDNTVECKMNNREGVGSLSCRLCNASFQMPIHHLHEPIDVFSEWLDACEAAQRNAGSSMTAGGGIQGVGGVLSGGGNQYLDDDDSDDNLGEASGVNTASNNNNNNDSDQRKSTSNSKGNGENEKARPKQTSYSALGLDSDDDDDDDDE